MINIVKYALAPSEARQILHGFHYVFNRQGFIVLVYLKPKLAIDFIAAYRSKIIARCVAEHPLEKCPTCGDGRGVARSAARIKLAQRIFFRVALVLLQRQYNRRVADKIVRTKQLDFRRRGRHDAVNLTPVQLFRRVGKHLACFRVYDVRRNKPAFQFVRRYGFLVNLYPGAADSRCLKRIEELKDILGLNNAKGLEKGGCEQLAATVHHNPKKIIQIVFELKPCAAIRNNAGIQQGFAVLMYFAFKRNAR